MSTSIHAFTHFCGYQAVHVVIPLSIIEKFYAPTRANSNTHSLVIQLVQVRVAVNFATTQTVHWCDVVWCVHVIANECYY